jgi:hypothetical protein
VSPVNYELGLYIPGEGVLHSHRRENIKTDITLILFNVNAADNYGFYGSENWEAISQDVSERNDSAKHLGSRTNAMKTFRDL